MELPREKGEIIMGLWIKTQDGELVNTDKLERIICLENRVLAVGDGNR